MHFELLENRHLFNGSAEDFGEVQAGEAGNNGASGELIPEVILTDVRYECRCVNKTQSDSFLTVGPVGWLAMVVVTAIPPVVVWMPGLGSDDRAWLMILGIHVPLLTSVAVGLYSTSGYFSSDSENMVEL